MENISSSMLIPRVNFEFAFNDADFSDRVLHIEIMDDSESCTVLKVKTLHISSLLLAGNSRFFQKLFKNGMRESKQTDATLRISTSEEAGVMELLNFMYSNCVKATTIPDVLGVLVVADKFEARDCFRYCCDLLQKMPVMSLESALLYLELPSSVLMHQEVQPLTDAAKEYLLTRFKDINKSQEEVMTLPLSAFAVLLESDRLLVDLLGDDTFEMILNWARAQYPECDRRREIIAKNLTEFIPFRHMSSSKLKEALICPDLDREEVTKFMLEAFMMVVDNHFGYAIDTSHEYPVVKVEQYGSPQPRCVVYFDLKREDCENLSSSSSYLESRSFRLGGRSFYLKAGYYKKELHHSFGLYLYMTEGCQSCTVLCEYESMKKSSMKFEIVRKELEVDKYNTDSSLGWGYHNLFNIPWSDFISKESEYFIDGILHLRADITIKDSNA